MVVGSELVVMVVVLLFLVFSYCCWCLCLRRKSKDYHSCFVVMCVDSCFSFALFCLRFRSGVPVFQTVASRRGLRRWRSGGGR